MLPSSIHCYTPFKLSTSKMSGYVPTISMSGLNQCTIVDLGSRYIRLGESGDIQSQYRYYSLIGEDNDVNEQRYEGRPCYELITNGLIRDYDRLEAKLGAAFQATGSTSCQCVSVVQPYFAPAEQRARLCETLFERLGARAVHFADAEAMVCMAAGRQTGISVLLGHGASTVAPIVDGQVLRQSASAFFWNGDRVGRSLASVTRSEAAQQEGPYKSTPETLLADLQRQHDLMQLCLQVTETPISNIAALEMAGGSSNIQLPDGTLLPQNAVKVAKILPESIFNTQLWATVDPDAQEGQLDAYNTLQYQILQSTQGLPAQVRRELSGGIVLAGGMSRVPGLSGRLRAEVETALSVYALSGRPRVLAPEPAGPDEAPFLGASVIASLGVFGCLVFTAQEYKESGAAGLERKRL